MVETPLVGRHQLRNIALAIAAAQELAAQGFTNITAATIERGIRETRWPGRFQVLPATTDHPEVVFDAAHNPAGAWALRSTLSAAYEDRPLVFVFGAMRDKAIGEIAEILFPLAELVVATQVDNPRAATVAEIRGRRPGRGRDCWCPRPHLRNRPGPSRRRHTRVGGSYRFDLHCRRSDACARRAH